jgi:hypothetical protein
VGGIRDPNHVVIQGSCTERGLEDPETAYKVGTDWYYVLDGRIDEMQVGGQAVGPAPAPTR